MANVKLSNNFLNITAFSAGTEESGYPKENAVDRVSPLKAWRSTDTSDTRYVIDLGSDQTGLTVYLDYLNFTGFKFQESADGSTGWADVTGTLTAQKDPMHGVYRHREEAALSSKRYLGIFIPSQTPADGSGYFRIGTVCVPTGITEISAGTQFGYPFTYELSDSHVVVNEYPTGKTDEARISELQPLFITMNLDVEVEYPNIAGSRVGEVMDYLRDRTRALYLDLNIGETWQAYLVKRDAQAAGTIEAPFLNTVSFGAVRLRVVT